MALSITKDTFNAEQAGKALGKLQGLPIWRQFGTLMLIAAAVAAGLMVFFWSQKPDYTPLYTGLDAKATAEATDLLRTAGIPFKIDPATGSITVPEKNVYDARLKLAGSGLMDADNGRVGFELMEKDPGFGVSQFVENARYQHALETELVRTITSLRPVRDARVHLAIPKPSAFTRQKDVASASVVLELRPGMSLERDQVDAIEHLVSSSIPDLSPERVAVVDQNGRLLSTDPNSQSALDNAQFDQVRRQEDSYGTSIRNLLEPITGPGRVNAQVSVDMDFSVTEEARELYNNDPAKVRSEQITQSSTTKPGPEGVPGATSNTPPPAQPANAAAAPPGANAQTAQAGTPVESASSQTRNFEMDRTLQHTRQPAGRVRRVTAAVLIDHVPRPGAGGKISEQALSPAELARIEALVKEAVGFNADRGDSVSVMNAPFVRDPDAGKDTTPVWQNPMLRDIAKLVLGAVVVLALLFGVLRPALRQITDPKPKELPGGGEPGLSVVEATPIDGEMPQQPDEAKLALEQAAQQRALASDAFEDRLRQAREAVRADSKQVAQVVKDWVNSDD